MKHSKVEVPDKLTGEEQQVIESLLKYPSLEKVFAENTSPGLEKIKDNMQSTIAELERVVRRGAQADAEKAVKISAAFQTTLNFLDELENIRQSQSK